MAQQHEDDQVFQTGVDPSTLFTDLSPCGAGTYGQVFLAHSKQRNRPVALKIMKGTNVNMAEVSNEISLLRKCQHENVVRFFAAYLHKNILTLEMEYCAGGSVADIRTVMNRSFSEPVLRYIFLEILKGLEYLHSQHLIHRDIKGQNILLTSRGGVRLADFGIAAQLAENQRHRSTFIGTPYWMAPEVILCEEKVDGIYDSRADIWSLGITLLEVGPLGDAPLAGVKPLRALFIITQKTPPTIDKDPENWSPHMHDFLSQCLQSDYTKRPYAADLLKHRFISEQSDKKAMVAELTACIAEYGPTAEDVDIPDDSSHHALPLANSHVIPTRASSQADDPQPIKNGKVRRVSQSSASASVGVREYQPIPKEVIGGIIPPAHALNGLAPVESQSEISPPNDERMLNETTNSKQMLKTTNDHMVPTTSNEKKKEPTKIRKPIQLHALNSRSAVKPAKEKPKKEYKPKPFRKLTDHDYQFDSLVDDNDEYDSLSDDSEPEIAPKMASTRGLPMHPLVAMEIADEPIKSGQLNLDSGLAKNPLEMRASDCTPGVDRGAIATQPKNDLYAERRKERLSQSSVDLRTLGGVPIENKRRSSTTNLADYQPDQNPVSLDDLVRQAGPPAKAATQSLPSPLSSPSRDCWLRKTARKVFSKSSPPTDHKSPGRTRSKVSLRSKSSTVSHTSSLGTRPSVGDVPVPAVVHWQVDSDPNRPREAFWSPNDENVVQMVFSTPLGPVAGAALGTGVILATSVGLWLFSTGRGSGKSERSPAPLKGHALSQDTNFTRVHVMEDGQSVVAVGGKQRRLHVVYAHNVGGRGVTCAPIMGISGCTAIHSVLHQGQVWLGVATHEGLVVVRQDEGAEKFVHVRTLPLQQEALHLVLHVHANNVHALYCCRLGFYLYDLHTGAHTALMPRPLTTVVAAFWTGTRFLLCFDEKALWVERHGRVLHQEIPLPARTKTIVPVNSHRQLLVCNGADIRLVSSLDGLQIAVGEGVKGATRDIVANDPRRQMAWVAVHMGDSVDMYTLNYGNLSLNPGL